MTLKELELSYHLSKNPHISNLANSISMSQSAISLAIKSLEKKLGEKIERRMIEGFDYNEKPKQSTRPATPRPFRKRGFTAREKNDNRK